LGLSRNGINRIGQGKLLKLKDVNAESTLWACPFSGEGPQRFLFMAASGQAAFKADLLEAVLKQAGNILLPSGEPSNADRREKQNDVMAALLRYSKKVSAFGGIVLRSPQSPPDRGTDAAKLDGFLKQLASMLGSFGAVVKLPSKDALILLPGNRDRNLISHRLSKTLSLTPLAVFESNQPERAFSLLRPYL
jgi:hypothetical protein